ncbi:MAG: TFIIB-type zinc ribbon-containing protein [Ruminococcaceae bacterium]|nr:TFIIB-type zinc ribbon-containing protein [Oscillospiraceae bacterium]
MSEQTATYECPNCGASLTFNAAEQLFTCEFCLSKFTREQVLSANSEEKIREQEAAEEAFNAQMNEYECKHCGAHVITDEHTVASECAYCHNPIVLVGRLSGEMKPQKIIPFGYDKAAAEEVFFKFVKKKWFVPKSFFVKEQVEKIAGIYYPFWVTDANTDSRIQAHATKVRTWRTGNREYTETSHFEIYRRGKIHFEDLTTAALSDADKKMLEGILPYPSAALEDFSMPYLSGYAAKKRNLERDDIKAELKGRIDHYSERILRATISASYTTMKVYGRESRVLNSHWDYSLLPVWVLTYRDEKRNKNYVYTMNGHTGKVHGELPVSRWKLAALFGAVATALTGLFTLIGGLIAK